MSEQGQIVKDVEIMHQGLIFKFQIKLMSGENPPIPPTEQTIDELKIVSSKTDDKGDSVYDLGNRCICIRLECTKRYEHLENWARDILTSDYIRARHDPAAAFHMHHHWYLHSSLIAKMVVLHLQKAYYNTKLERYLDFFLRIQS